MANTFIANHEYKEEALHYAAKIIAWHWIIFPEIVFYVDRVGCLCGKSKGDRIHKPLRVDKF